MDNFDPTSQVDDVVGRPWMNPDKYPVPSTQSTPVPRSPNGGHPPSFGIGDVNNDIDNDIDKGSQAFPFVVEINGNIYEDCPLSDQGPDGCGARMAKGEVNNYAYLVDSQSIWTSL